MRTEGKEIREGEQVRLMDRRSTEGREREREGRAV